MTTVEMKTSKGTITIQLDTENTPNTAQNFVEYVKNGFYDGTIFHRVIDGFMIQGGGFTTEMEQKEPNTQIKNEANKGKKNKLGTIAMARTSDPHSATAQFFINIKDNDFLDFSSESANGWGYCVFGEVTEGLDVINEIKKVKTGSRKGHQDVPVENVVIEKVTLIEAE
jgi:peptidyl-prolyl cis-trans isomerase B (cyclophilin B)